MGAHRKTKVTLKGLATMDYEKVYEAADAASAEESKWQGLPTIGEIGSEEGVIVADWETSDGARVTVEEDGRIAPFSITMGIYGCGFHTMFYGSSEVAMEKARSLMAEIDVFFTQIDADPDFDPGDWFDSVVSRY